MFPVMKDHYDSHHRYSDNDEGDQNASHYTCIIIRQDLVMPLDTNFRLTSYDSNEVIGRHRLTLAVL